MLIKNQRGFSSTELLIAIAFMGIMVFYSYQMLVRQKRVVIRVNQNVEATTHVFEMRKLLQGAGCRENFRGYNRIQGPGAIMSLKALRQFEDGTSEIREVFKVAGMIADKESSTGLEIESYQLTPSGVKSMMRSDRTYLVVTFARSELKETFQKQIRIYTQELNGVITDCSLVPFNKNQGYFAQNAGELLFKKEKINLGATLPIGTVSVKGGYYATPPLGGCHSQTAGALYYDKKDKVWELCTLNGVRKLVDKRKLPE